MSKRGAKKEKGGCMKKFKILISVVLILCLSTLCVSALSKIGSQSDEVRQIQTVLKQKGYYQGNIDGIFGTNTKKAVTDFQRDNGLKVDGIAGTQTLKALGLASSGGYTSSDFDLLARIISA